MSNPNNPSDFALVRLTQAGLKFTGDAQALRLGNAHSDYTFTGQTPQKVVRRGELPMFLAYTLPDGSPVFELVADLPATSPVAAAVATATTEVTHAE